MMGNATAFLQDYTKQILQDHVGKSGLNMPNIAYAKRDLARTYCGKLIFGICTMIIIVV